MRVGVVDVGLGKQRKVVRFLKTARGSSVISKLRPELGSAQTLTLWIRGAESLEMKLTAHLLQMSRLGIIGVIPPSLHKASFMYKNNSGGKPAKAWC
jgi:hypothetical protein